MWKWKNKTIRTLSGGSLSSNLVCVARTLNQNAEVLKECCQKVDELKTEIEQLKADKEKLKE